MKLIKQRQNNHLLNYFPDSYYIIKNFAISDEMSCYLGLFLIRRKGGKIYVV